MYTLLLVDDEFYTRKGILKSIPFGDLGISTILEAEDGKAGLDLAQNTPIDIVLADIRMPKMDGTEMAREIRALYPDCVIIFLSGYSDKDYLRSAIDLRAFRYIDKPVDTEVVTSVLAKAVSYCDQLKHSNIFYIDAQKKALAKNLVSVALVSAHMKTQIVECGLSLENFCDSKTMIIQLLNDQVSDSSVHADFCSVLDSCMSLVGEVLETFCIPYLMTDYREKYIVAHLLSSDKRMISAISDTCFSNIFDSITSKIAIFPHFISIGHLANTPGGLRSSYNSAVIGLQSNFYLGINSISYSSSHILSSYELQEELLQKLQQSVFHTEKEVCLDLLVTLCSTYKAHSGTLVSVVKENYHRILTWMFYYINDKKLDISFQSERYIWEIISSVNTLYELHEFTANYFSAYFDNKLSMRLSSISASIHQLIAEHYSNPDLNIQFLSDKLNLSCSYLSYLYKQDTNDTINQTIIQYRIQKAKEMLQQTNKKVSEIACACGLTDHNYFTKLFRKITGLSPTEFREVYLK
jgi:two-component system response regulator YesN